MSTPSRRKSCPAIARSLATYFAAWSTDFRAGLGDFHVRFQTAHPQTPSFAAATSEDQIAFLQTVDRTPVFETTRMLILLGMFSSPRYGGNFEGAGWRMMGFEDRHVFMPPFGYYDAACTGFVPYADKHA